MYVYKITELHTHTHTHTGGAKIPGIVKKIYLKYSYKFETSIIPSEYSSCDWM
jgi:hypothetical protein